MIQGSELSPVGHEVVFFSFFHETCKFNIKRAFWYVLSLCLSQKGNRALFQQLCLKGREQWPLDDLTAPGRRKRRRPWLQPFLKMHKRPMVVRSSFHCVSGQVPQAALISWHTNPHRRQRSTPGQCREPGAVNQHLCCERPTFSFQSSEWVKDLPGWFVASMLLSISLQFTAGGGQQPANTHSSNTSRPHRKLRERCRNREKQVLSCLPHSSNMLKGNFAAGSALYDNPGSSSALISATKVHLRFSLFTIFLNNVINAANYSFYALSILCLGDRRTQAWHTSPAALFMPMSAWGLTVAPLHFHINSSKACWNQCYAEEETENHYTLHPNSPPRCTRSHITADGISPGMRISIF